MHVIANGKKRYLEKRDFFCFYEILQTVCFSKINFIMLWIMLNHFLIFFFFSCWIHSYFFLRTAISVFGKCQIFWFSAALISSWTVSNPVHSRIFGSHDFFLFPVSLWPSLVFPRIIIFTTLYFDLRHRWPKYPSNFPFFNSIQERSLCIGHR